MLTISSVKAAGVGLGPSGFYGGIKSYLTVWMRHNPVEMRLRLNIQRERLQSFLRKLNYACGKKRGGSPILIQVEGANDTVVEYNTQERVQNLI
jgi:hypothetical protein